MEKHSTRATAYPGSEAQIYDAKRFVTQAGQHIHAIETAKVLDGARNLPAGASLAEIGCGTGRVLAEFKGRGFSLTGLDASEEMLKQAASKFSQDEDVTFRVASAHDTGFKSDSFDFVYSIRLLNQTESAPFALSVLNEIARIAKPGARVVVEYIPAARPALGAASRRSVRLSARQVVRAAEDAGLSVERVRGSFLLGMQSFERSPTWALRPLALLDQFADRFLPKFCARCYLIAVKG